MPLDTFEEIFGSVSSDDLKLFKFGSNHTALSVTVHIPVNVVVFDAHEMRELALKLKDTNKCKVSVFALKTERGYIVNNADDVKLI